VTADDVIARLAGQADDERATFVRRILGVAPGNYGEGDIVLGIPMPALRSEARAARALSLGEVARLLQSPVHEHRMTALVILVDRHRRAARRDPAGAAVLARFYLNHRAGVDNWDLVDVSAPDLLGGELVAGRREPLEELAASERLWDRRIAVISTYALIRAGEFGETLVLCERFLDDPHHLMHKACGWMLREVGKRDEEVLLAWLEEHRHRMPRTMLRYALERIGPDRRAALMARA
jgi:3-methyladenine DNA glycosylase AlkD